MMQRVSSSYGFTIVELLIVIVVIAVLATITIVAYNGVTARASDTAIQSDLTNGGKLILQFHATQGAYPSDLAELGETGLKASTSAYGNHIVSGGNYNFLYCLTATGDNFALVAASAGGGVFTFVDGSTKTFAGSWSGGWGTICPSAFTPADGGASGIWIYSNSSWPAWAS